MRRYRTEILIPPDRYVGLQLPSHLPEGRAVITVTILEPDDPGGAEAEAELDRSDIEWWEEFDAEPEAESGPDPEPGDEGSAPPA